MKYNCDLCSFSSSKKFNYEKHLQSKKHIKRSQRKDNEENERISSTSSSQEVKDEYITSSSSSSTDSDSSSDSQRKTHYHQTVPTENHIVISDLNLTQENVEENENDLEVLDSENLENLQKENQNQQLELISSRLLSMEESLVKLSNDKRKIPQLKDVTQEIENYQHLSLKNMENKLTQKLDKITTEVERKIDAITEKMDNQSQRIEDKIEETKLEVKENSSSSNFLIPIVSTNFILLAGLAFKAWK